MPFKKKKKWYTQTHLYRLRSKKQRREESRARTNFEKKLQKKLQEKRKQFPQRVKSTSDDITQRAIKKLRGERSFLSGSFQLGDKSGEEHVVVGSPDDAPDEINECYAASRQEKELMERSLSTAQIIHLFTVGFPEMPQIHPSFIGLLHLRCAIGGFPSHKVPYR